MFSRYLIFDAYKEIETKASNIKVPVKTVNNKTGDENGNVDIKAIDIKTSSGQTVESQLADYTTHKKDTSIHVTETEKSTWNSKQNNLGFIPENSSNKGKPNGYASLGSDGKVSSTQLPVMANVDNGRYQSEFGFDDADFSYVNTNTISLDKGVGSRTEFTITGYENYTSNKRGFYFKALSNIDSITVVASALPPSANQDSATTLKVYVYDDADSLLASSSITRETPVTLQVNLTVGKIYSVVMDNGGINYTTPYSSSFKLPITTSDFQVVDGRSGNSNTSLLFNFKSFSVTVKAINGTVTKTYTPSDIKKWGNAKWTQITPSSTSIVCDVLKSDGTTVLKSNITSIADLGDIDVVVNPNIKIRWTLSRKTINDVSPTISNPSITWEGRGVKVLSGSYYDTTTVIPIGSTYTKTIPLGFKAKRGMIVAKGNVTSTTNIAEIHFSDIPNDAFAVNISNYDYRPNLELKLRKDGSLCSMDFIDNRGVGFFGSGVGLKDCYIEGTNLILIFEAGWNNEVKTLNAQVNWEVEG